MLCGRQAWLLRSALAVAVLSLFSWSDVRAQAPRRDPVEVYQDVLDLDLDNLPTPGDMAREGTRKKILDFREESLKKAVAGIDTLRDLTRALRMPYSKKLTSRRGDPGLRRIDDAAYAELRTKFRDKFDAGVKGKNVVEQRALAALAGELIGGTALDQRINLTQDIVDARNPKSLLSQLVVLAEVKDEGVQEQVARSFAMIIFVMKEALTPEANAKIRTTIQSIQKAPTPSPRRAAVDAAGALITLLNPDTGEENNQPRDLKREDLLDMLGLTQILLAGVNDPDAETRVRATRYLYRMSAHVSRNTPNLFITTPLAPIARGREATPDEKAFIKKQQEEFAARDLKVLREKLREFQTKTGVFEKAVSDKDIEVRLYALRTLEEMAILDAAVKERIVPVPGEKPDAIEGLHPLFDDLFKTVNPDLLKNLNDGDARVRLAAAQVIETRGAEARAQGPALVTRLGDGDPFVRWVAARALGRVQGEPIAGSVAGLSRTLHDEDLAVRVAAANSLENLGEHAGTAVMDLLAVANKGDADFPEAALRALGAAGPYVPPAQLNPEKRGRTIVPVLAEGLKHADSKVRRAAAMALGRFGKDPALSLAADALRKALDDDEPDVRRYAAEALLAGK